jgi:hypothetical protein
MNRIDNTISESNETFRQIFFLNKAIMLLLEPETMKELYAKQATADFAVIKQKISKICLSMSSDF